VQYGNNFTDTDLTNASWKFLTDLENNLANSRRATTPLPLSSDPNERL